MRLFAALGVILLALVVGGAVYAYLGFYNVAASDPHVDYVRWSLETAQDSSVERHAARQVGHVPPLDNTEMIRTGAQHYREEGCIQCHGGPGNPQAEFARHMRPEPPDLTQAVRQWNDSELFWIMQHGIKMTGMPAFGPTHNEDELWAMVAFVRRLPEMGQSEFQQLTASPQGAGHHADAAAPDGQESGADHPDEGDHHGQESGPAQQSEGRGGEAGDR